MPRSYQLKKRARRQQETRRRITEATVELHRTVGPVKTTISAIAEKAGVERLTVYRHFPDERSLLEACSGHWNAANPPPDPAPWRKAKDPEDRLRTALGEMYAYYGRTEPMLSNVLPDAQKMPALAEVLVPYGLYMEAVRETLAVGWGARGRRRGLLLATLGHALEFETWRSLVRRQGLNDEQAVELMVNLVRCTMSDR